MKNTIKRKLHQSIEKLRPVNLKVQFMNTNWTPFLSVVLTGLIGYAAYALCSHIPVVDYCSSGSWQVFG